MSKETEEYLNDKLPLFAIGFGLSIAVIEWLGRTITIFWGVI